MKSGGMNIISPKKKDVSFVVTAFMCRFIELFEINYNENPIDWYITEMEVLNSIVYPYSKAIVQALIAPVPNVNREEISYEDLKAIPSERGLGKLGSSNK